MARTNQKPQDKSAGKNNGDGEQPKTKNKNGKTGDKKKDKSPVVAKKAKPVKVVRHHGDSGVPDYNKGKLPKGFSPEKSDTTAILIEGGIAELISLPKDTKGVLVNVPDSEGRNATFYAVGGGFTKDDPDLGRKVVVEYVEVYFRSAEPGNAMHAYGKTLDGVFVTKSQIKVEVLNKSSTMPESTYKARLALHAYLHGAWVDAGCPQPTYVPSASADFVEVVRSVELEPVQGGELTFAQLREVLAQPEYVEEQDRRKGATSRAQDFAKAQNGRYFFPNKSPAVFLEIQNGVITIEEIEEGHVLYESLKGYVGACFLFAQLNGDLPLPREVQKRSSQQGRALSDLIKALRRFLLACPAFGFKVLDGAVHPVNLPSDGPFDFDKPGCYTRDGFDFQVDDVRGNHSPYKAVRVLYTPEGFPERSFLVQLMRAGVHVPASYVIKQGVTADSDLPKLPLKFRKNAASLRRAVRLAVGLEDCHLSLVETASQDVVETVELQTADMKSA